MNTTTISEHDNPAGISNLSSGSGSAPVRVQAHRAAVKHLGNWTAERAFDVRANRGVAVLDLRSPRIAAGDIRIDVDLDRAVLKLLVPDDAVIDSWDLRREGRGKVKDAGASPVRSAEADPSTSDAAPEPRARHITLVGRLHDGEIRVQRSGVAVLTAMCSREFLTDLRRAHREGTMPTVADPAGEA